MLAFFQCELGWNGHPGPALSPALEGGLPGLLRLGHRSTYSLRVALF